MLAINKASQSPGNSGSHVNKLRYIYHSVAPRNAVLQVDVPECHICRFTPDGKYLICFAAAFQELVVYRFNGHSCSVPGDGSSGYHGASLPSSFQSFFTLIYRKNMILNSAEALCSDFCVFPIPRGGDGECYFMLLASQSTLKDPARMVFGAEPAPPTQVPGAPMAET
eukprot:gene28028-31128_t